MGLLINLAEHEAGWRQRLRQLRLPLPAGGATGSRQLVPLLCTLLSAVAAPRAPRPDPSPSAAGKQRNQKLRDR